jgi:hypothetical protein
MATIRGVFENGEPERLIEFDPAEAPFQHDGRPGSILDEGQVMETRELSPSQSKAVEARIPSVFPGRSWPGAVVESLMAALAALDDRWFDQRSLLRWADDGGRWVGEGNSTLHEVRR